MSAFNFRLDKLKELTCPPNMRHMRFMDVKTPGLSLRVRPSGTKTYLFYRRLPDNNESPRKLCEITIGKFEDVTLEQARKKVIELSHLVGEGKDPSLLTRDHMTFGELFRSYLERYAKVHNSTWAETEKNYHRYFLKWDRQDISTIKREQVQAWVNALGTTNGPATAMRNLNTFRAVFSWGSAQGIFDGDNPCIGIKTFKIRARERFLQPGDEFLRFANALNEEPNTTIRHFFWICLLTGARCSNVLAMEWSQINMDLHQWRIPITKNGDSQTIPLTTSAMEILRARHSEQNVDKKWVFPSDRDGWKTRARTHIVSPRKAFCRIIRRAGIDDLRIHDLRRTAGSYMAMQNVSPTIIGKALGHKSPQATAIYARLTQDPIRQAMEAAQAALSDPGKLLSAKGFPSKLRQSQLKPR